MICPVFRKECRVFSVLLSSSYLCYILFMKYRTEIDESLFEHWPDAFYAREGAQRLDLLKAHMEHMPEDPEDKRRMESLKGRYDRDRDRYLLAWMMLKVLAEEPVTFLNRRKHEKDIRENLGMLGVFEPDDCQKKEWENFGRTLVKKYADSPSFRAALFGMGSVGDRNTALRLAHEILTVTEKVPSSLRLEEEVLPFAEIVKEQFIALIPEGEDLLREAYSR